MPLIPGTMRGVSGQGPAAGMRWFANETSAPAQFATAVGILLTVLRAGGGGAEPGSAGSAHCCAAGRVLGSTVVRCTAGHRTLSKTALVIDKAGRLLESMLCTSHDRPRKLIWGAALASSQ